MSEYDRQYYAKNRERIRARQKDSYSKNPKKYNAATRRWYLANAEKVKAVNKIWVKNNSDKIHVSNVKCIYKLSREEAIALIARKKSGCENRGCKTKFFNPNIDHDHKTGKIRGILCGHCNRALGCLQDDTGQIEGLRNYLIESNNTHEI